MVSVFIAMPYGDHNPLEVRLRNTENAMAVWHQLADLGFMPYCPHLSHFLHEYSARERQSWLAHSRHWLTKCDTMLICGWSEGVTMEAGVAMSLHIPVFSDIESLCKAYQVLV